ncbi:MULTISPECIES: nitrate reductase molybdenum cofactor assembly chaperone [Tatumella]|uniref:Nitrate reductase molybdenum cofactor assembly chaperone n=1 Tax=Tatumella punctata TaxID=399969 RepID=A0ABW1VM20_9GAMM|nr:MULTISPECIES: nitrate reductase molybdenum cofactor assembly chaperone [unclassified Tatumella]MBS0855810.1 nitrate reductase molybdenum cofactor assembly chaperone [Tatumella sp. JGM16]MBS0878280.1 nitrate reductase molybdenum cofactor assembly chaperone [Tatumella sp. JGM82]MBS0891769.1 nitrate reductase molybdenum cofactor assembly chaperone [Tatumella sp. JGM94]MBS0894757.1 nitrate reductase molybdenum cofactor assembly chaperone [Tatumella sp. JGM130]MBS0902994.1 nitrate reductase moly
MSPLKLIAVMLEYPSQELWDAADEILPLIEAECPQLLAFAACYLQAPLLDRQQEWCETFDRGRATSMLMFEHVHAESRDRGQAMVDLLAQYQAAGLEAGCRELPDYLPVYLEYLSLCSAEDSRQGLLDVAEILALLGGRLAQRGSDYRLLFDQLLMLADSPLRSHSVLDKIAGESRDDTPQAMDAIWEEEQVKFIADPACKNAAEQQYRQRFRQQVTPQYLDLSAGGGK